MREIVACGECGETQGETRTSMGQINLRAREPESIGEASIVEYHFRAPCSVNLQLVEVEHVEIEKLIARPRLERQWNTGNAHTRRNS